MWRRMYHVTRSTCVSSIIEGGLNPAYSKGKIQAVWLADSKRLQWAIAHVSLKHSEAIAYLWVAVCHVDPRELKKFRWPGIYLAEQIVPIFDIYPASDIINRGPIRMDGSRSKI